MVLLLLHLLIRGVHVGVGEDVAWYSRRGQSTTYRSWFSAPTVQVLRTKLSSQVGRKCLYLLSHLTVPPNAHS